jgi:hypothetical protein
MAALSRFQGGQRVMGAALVAALLGWALLALGFVLDPQRAFFAYLLAFAYVASVALGMLVFLMAVHAAGAKWPVVVRRLLEAGASSLPLLMVLFVPLLFGLRALFPWTTPAAIEDAHARELVEKKLAYLNVPFFIARSFVYLGFWAMLALLLRHWSLRRTG